MRQHLSDWPCSLARVLDLFDGWSMLIMRDLYHGLSRFDEFTRSLGMATNVLADRLKRLVDVGMIERCQYQASPPRSEYVLTDRGRDFFPVVVAMSAWGDRWLSDGAGAPISFRHLPCGRDLGAEVVCVQCNEPIDVRDVEFRVGPGYPLEVPPGRDVRDRFHRGTGELTP